jgi:hypothetical protein
MKHDPITLKNWATMERTAAHRCARELVMRIKDGHFVLADACLDDVDRHLAAMKLYQSMERAAMESKKRKTTRERKSNR